MPTDSRIFLPVVNQNGVLVEQNGVKYEERVRTGQYMCKRWECPHQVPIDTQSAGVLPGGHKMVKKSDKTS